MKGFPNQVADLAKLAAGMRSLVRLVDEGHNAKDDAVFGEDLLRAGVAGTGHTPVPVERYLREQRRRRPSNQSFRTTARGLRELYRLFGLIDDLGARVVVTDLGRQAAGFADRPLDADQIDFWRRVIRNVAHRGEQPEASHPYQVLLRLVGRKPGITRTKCALALEARNGSPEELDRIARLADLSEEEIRRRIGVTEANWDNAKKVLPSLAEQLGDVIVTRRAVRKPTSSPMLQVVRMLVRRRLPRWSRRAPQEASPAQFGGFPAHRAKSRLRRLVAPERLNHSMRSRRLRRQSIRLPLPRRIASGVIDFGATT